MILSTVTTFWQPVSISILLIGRARTTTRTFSISPSLFVDVSSYRKDNQYFLNFLKTIYSNKSYRHFIFLFFKYILCKILKTQIQFNFPLVKNPFTTHNNMNIKKRKLGENNKRQLSLRNVIFILHNIKDVFHFVHIKQGCH